MEEFKQEVEDYIELVNEFNTLHDVDYAKAYVLHKMALAQYERWSNILFDVRLIELKTKIKRVPVKDRVEHILKTLNNIYTSSRMVWSKGKSDLNGDKY